MRNVKYFSVLFSTFSYVFILFCSFFYFSVRDMQLIQALNLKSNLKHKENSPVQKSVNNFGSQGDTTRQKETQEGELS